MMNSTIKSTKSVKKATRPTAYATQVKSSAMFKSKAVTTTGKIAKTDNNKFKANSDMATSIASLAMPVTFENPEVLEPLRMSNTISSAFNTVAPKKKPQPSQGSGKKKEAWRRGGSSTTMPAVQPTA